MKNQINSEEAQARPKVALISNCLNNQNRAFLKERNGYVTDGVMSPFRFSYKNNHGIIPILDVVPSDLFSISGMKFAKQCFLNAVDYSIEQGVKVILLAASTKRLFGDGKELKEKYPEVTFTIGDNGTSLAFLKQIEYVTSNLSYDSPIVIVGAGFLGTTAIQHLHKNGYKNINVITRHKLTNIDNVFSYKSLDEYIQASDKNKAHVLLGCAHNHNIQREQLLKLVDKKLFIIDVAVPKAIPQTLFADIDDDRIVRFDGGDFEIKDLKLDFPPYLAGLNYEGEFYGCFTEALCLASSNHKSKTNFFHVSDTNIQLVNNIINNYNEDIFISLKNFGQSVTGYNNLLKVS